MFFSRAHIMKSEFILVAIVVVLVLLLCMRAPREQFSVTSDAIPGESYVRLYEGFKYTNMVFNKTGDGLYYRILMPINLKSLDINLTDGTDKVVSIWSVYPEDVLSSSVATGIYMDTYTDPWYAFRANSPKYQRVATVAPGTRLQMEVEEPVKRIFMVIKT